MHKCRRICGLIASSLVVSLLAAPPASAYFIVVLEQQTATIGNEVLIGTAATFEDLLTPSFTNHLTAWDPPNAYDIAGITYDGQFRVVLEQHTATIGNEVLIGTAATFEDLLTPSFTNNITAWDPPNAYDIAGITYDGQYRVVLEQHTATIGNEVLIGTAATFADLLTPSFTNNITAWDPPNAYDIAGIAYDGQYRVILERHTGTLGNEVLIGTAATFADLLTPSFTNNITAWDPPNAYNIVGFTWVPDDIGPAPVPVPEPGSAVLLITSLLAMAFRRRLGSLLPG